MLACVSNLSRFAVSETLFFCSSFLAERYSKSHTELSLDAVVLSREGGGVAVEDTHGLVADGAGTWSADGPFPCSSEVALCVSRSGGSATAAKMRTLWAQQFVASLRDILYANARVILVLDEMDQMVTRKQDVMYNVFDWTRLPQSGFSVIAIANQVVRPLLRCCMPVFFLAVTCMCDKKCYCTCTYFHRFTVFISGVCRLRCVGNFLPACFLVSSRVLAMQRSFFVAYDERSDDEHTGIEARAERMCLVGVKEHDTACCAHCAASEWRRTYSH